MAPGAVHLRCHKFSKLDKRRSSRINDGVSRPSPVRRPCRLPGRESTVLRGISPIVEISDSWSYAWLISVQHLKPGLQIAMRVDNSSSTTSQSMRWTATFVQNIGALMLRIERITNSQVVFTLSGRMQTEDIEQVQKLLDVEDAWAAGNAGFAERDAREPGCGDISRRLRGQGDRN